MPEIEDVFYAQPNRKLIRGLLRYRYVGRGGHVKWLVGNSAIDKIWPKSVALYEALSII